MMDLRKQWILPLVLPAILACGCTPRARYESKLKSELAKGVRNDSVFMGLYLGMTEKEFYMQCWNLNHKGLVKQGGGNSTVQYMMKNELKYKATMDFYPKFSNGRIFEMPVKFAYTGWTPWNRKFSSEKLEKDVLRYYKKIYGSDFISVRDPKKGTAYIKIDGNRRITIFRDNDPYVWAVFKDLLPPVDSAAVSVQPPAAVIDSVDKPAGNP